MAGRGGRNRLREQAAMLYVESMLACISLKNPSGRGGLTQKQIGITLGVSQQTVSRYYRDTTALVMPTILFDDDEIDHDGSAEMGRIRRRARRVLRS